MAAPRQEDLRFYVSFRSGRDEQPGLRVLDALRARFGPDALLAPLDASLPPEDSARQLNELLDRCDVLIAVIGPDWLGGLATSIARREIAAALSKDHLVVVPVVVRSGRVPVRAELPADVRGLAEWREVELTDARWDADAAALMSAVEKKAALAREIRSALAPVAGVTPAQARALIAACAADLPTDRLATLQERLGAVTRAEERVRDEAAEAHRMREDQRRAAELQRLVEERRRQLEEEGRRQLEEQQRRAAAEAATVAASLDTGAVRVVRPPRTAAEPRHVDENVQFTVYRPSAVQPDRWYPVLAFAHLSERRPDAAPDEPDPVAEMQAQAARALGEAIAEFRSVTEDSGYAVVREGELRFVPEMEGVEFNPRERRFLWTETVHGEHFRMRASRALDGRVARGTLTVYAGNLLLADVRFSVRVDSRATEGAQEQSAARPYRRIFASYSHRDTPIVEEFEAHAKATGDRYLRDVVSLRAGEVWDDRLIAMINQADVFQLFWSWNALASPMVRAEWQHALGLNRPHFVRPVYWEEPLPAQADLPPPQLRRLHFQRVYPRVVAAVDAAVAPAAPSAARRTEAILVPPADIPPHRPVPPRDVAVPPFPEPAGTAEAPARTTSTMVRVARYGSIAAAAVLAVGLFVQMRNDRAFTGPDFEVAPAPPSEAPTGSAPPDSAAPDSPPPPPPAAPSTDSAPRPVPSAPNSEPPPGGPGGLRGRITSSGRGSQPSPTRPAPSAPPMAGRGGRAGGAIPGTQVPAQPTPVPPPPAPSAPAEPVEAPAAPAAPVPSAPPPAGPGPSSGAAIEMTLREYERAFAEQNLAALHRIWRVPEQETARLQRLFSEARAIDVRVRVIEMRILSDTRAVVVADELRRVLPTRSDAVQAPTRRRTFHLERREGTWIIVAIAD